MRTSFRVASVCAAFSLSLGAGCVAEEPGSEVDDLTSKDAVFIEMTFSGEVIAEASESDAERKKSIVAQLFYMSGELDKVHSGHGQFAFAEIEEVTAKTLEDGLERVAYTARVPVAWPKRRAFPETYRVVLPMRVDPSGLDDFNRTYKGSCGKAKYGADTLWYDFTPVSSSTCEIAEGDALDVVASVKEHPRTTTDKRPEIERFWDDGAFRMVLVHGTDAASSYDSSDVGVRQYDSFKRKLREAYPDGEEQSHGEGNSEIYDDWQFETTIAKPGGGEGKLIINALLSSSLKYIGNRFDERFGPLSKEADLISYGGHSGLSKNIKALAAKEQVAKEHYQVWFIDGCSTFAYLDRTLVDARIDINGSEIDPNGTKFLDLILNAQPAPWYTGADSQMIVLGALADTKPHSYMSIVDELGSSATPVVSGEEDNPSIDE